jgi:hypothetical protein
VIAANGAIGQGTTTPTSLVASDGFVQKSALAFGPTLMQINSVAGASAAYVIQRKDRNGAIVQSGDALGNYEIAGYDGASYCTAAAITAAVDGTPGTNDMPGRLVFSTTADGASSPTERMRITSAGNVGIGDAGNAAQTLRLAKNITGGVAAAGVQVSATVQSDVTSTATGLATFLSTQATAFTATNLIHFTAVQGTKGAGSTITNQFGFLANDSLTGATNNYGFFSNIASGTGRWNFYAAGTAANYFAGNVGIGTTSAIGQLNVVGTGGIVTGAATTADSAIIRTAEPLSTYPTNFKSVSIQYKGTTATGTTAGISNADQGQLAFTNTASALISTNGAVPLIFATSSTQRGQISGTGVWSLGAAPGAESLRVTPVASAVNYWDVQGAAAAGTVSFISAGSDTNVNALIGTKGTGVVLFRTGGGVNDQFRVNHTASSVNYLTVTGAVTGASPSIGAAGTDANISIAYQAKGTSGHFFQTSGGNQFNIAHTASAVNYLQVTGGAAGSVPTLQTQGSDANIGLALVAKGAGFFNLQTGGGTQFLVSNTASAVNYLQVTGSASTFPTLFASGSGSNVAVAITSKGTGDIVLQTNFVTQFEVTNTASAVNRIRATGGATGNAPVLSAQGSDTNIDLALTPKGTGVLRFGTHTVGILAQSGYITIKDAAGNTRNLLVG